MISPRFILGSLCAVICLVFAACFAHNDDPPLYTYDTVALTQLSANAHARDIGGRVYYVLNTHSMEPLIKGGDLIVVDTHYPYANLTKGVPITYQAQWLPPTDPPVTHRTQVKMPDGWVCEGDANGINGANPKSGLESWRVTEKEYIGKVVGIYRVKA